MALTEPAQVSTRMKHLRTLAGNPSQYAVAAAIDVPPRTFQSWENAEVETDRKNYERVARYYSRKLKRKVTVDWILFGQDEAPPLPTTTRASVNGDMADADLRAQVQDLHAKVDRIIDALGLDADADQHPLDQISEIAGALPGLLAADDETAAATETDSAGS